MIEENERAAKFMQAIQRDGEKRRTAIIQAIDEETAAELEKVKTAAEAKARQMGDYEKVRLQEETNRKLSHSVVETGAELLPAAARSLRRCLTPAKSGLPPLPQNRNMPTI